MKKNYFIFVEHILESIEKIEVFMKNIKKEMFLENEEKQSAVVRQIEIIGEAVKNLPDFFKKKYPKIPWQKISGTRDKLIHYYFGVDLDAVWDIIKEDLPALKIQIKEILKQKN